MFTTLLAGIRHSLTHTYARSLSYPWHEYETDNAANKHSQNEKNRLYCKS